MKAAVAPLDLHGRLGSGLRLIATILITGLFLPQ